MIRFIPEFEYFFLCSISFGLLGAYFGLDLRFVWAPCLKQQEAPECESKKSIAILLFLL